MTDKYGMHHEGLKYSNRTFRNSYRWLAILGTPIATLPLFSCSKIVANMLEKPPPSRADAYDGHETDGEFRPDVTPEDDLSDLDTTSSEIHYEVIAACYDMAAVGISCDPPRDCPNGIKGCEEKCDDNDSYNGDGCDPACFFETKVCTLARPFSKPADIVVEGSIAYVADAGDHTIKKIDISGEQVSVLAGFPGEGGYQNGQGSTARFYSPSGIEILHLSSGTTANNYLIVSDSANNRIRKVDISTGEVTDLAGNGVNGSVDGICQEARFNSPAGLATDGNSIFVADRENDSVRRIVKPLGADCTVETIPSAGNINKPVGITYDPENNHLYVASSKNYVIVQINLDSTSSTAIVAGTLNSQGTFYEPAGIDFNGTVLIVADMESDLIREIEVTNNYRVTTLAGGDNIESCVDSEISGNSATFHKPTCVAFDKSIPEGPFRVFICDDGCGSIRIIK